MLGISSIDHFNFWWELGQRVLAISFLWLQVHHHHNMLHHTHIKNHESSLPEVLNTALETMGLSRGFLHWDHISSPRSPIRRQRPAGRSCTSESTRRRQPVVDHGKISHIWSNLSHLWTNFSQLFTTFSLPDMMDMTPEFSIEIQGCRRSGQQFYDGAALVRWLSRNGREFSYKDYKAMFHR